jgi:hypothetical protein
MISPQMLKTQVSPLTATSTPLRVYPIVDASQCIILAHKPKSRRGFFVLVPCTWFTVVLSLPVTLPGCGGSDIKSFFFFLQEEIEQVTLN